MREKILRTMIGTVLAALICLGIVMMILLASLKNVLTREGEAAGQNAREMSMTSMNDMTTDMLTEMSQSRAQIADDMFSDIQDYIEVIADDATDVYLHPGNYGRSVLSAPTKDELGTTKTMAAYAEDVNPSDSAIQDELSRLASLQGLLLSVNNIAPNISQVYIGTESGIYISAETVGEWSFPDTEDGVLRFDPRERPWYKKAMEAGKATFTGVFEDADTGDLSISCGVPIYGQDDQLIGVAGTGLHLDEVQEDVLNYRIGSDGFFCIVNDEGVVLFTGRNVAEIKAADGQDIRASENKDLAELATDALSGESGIRTVSLDDEDYYIAYAPMETVGWSYMAVLPQSEVAAPTEELGAMLDKSSGEQVHATTRAIISALAVLVAVIAAMGFVVIGVASRLSDRLVAPIEQLTDGVRSLQGDNLDFSLQIDTGDEVQTLAEAFGSMTERMKKYIVDITTITAEKERIGAELSVATEIQASMLPSIFPPFPEREEFELFAKMNPAKEVGGDFYDFFFVDQNHLAVVIADVSGKGVPASLFMVIAKTLIKNHAQLNERVNDVLMNSNNQLCEGNGGELFVTAWIGVVDLRTGEMDFADAGHEIPYIIHADGSFDALKPERKRPPLAAMEDMPYGINHAQLAPGDLLFLYTDGVPEATNAANELYGMDRLEEVAKAHYADNPETFLSAMRADVDKFVGDAPQFDDLTMLGLRMLHYSEK